MLLLACIMAHWIKEGRYVPLEDLPGVGAGVEFTTVAEMWDNVAMLAAWGGGQGTEAGPAGLRQAGRRVSRGGNHGGGPDK